MAQISIIVPVYKVEPYLRRCVDSILNQSFSDFDLILVDDGSPDTCGVICDKYAAKDSRVHVIHQKNGGLSAARNAGIDWAFAHSDSSWLTFVDSDDWIHPQMLEALHNAVRKDDTSVAVCGYQETSGEDPVVLPEQLESSLWTPDDFYVRHNCNATLAWGKLYEKRCFETLRYPAGKIHEDEYVTYQILFRFPRISVIPAPLYAYFVNTQGITKCAWTPKKLDAWGAYDEQLAFFQGLGKERIVKQLLRTYLFNAMGQLNQIPYSDRVGQYRSQVKMIREKIRILLRTIQKAGYRDILQEYWKAKVDDWMTRPFIWKADLVKRWKKQ